MQNASTATVVDPGEVYKQHSVRFTKLNDILYRMPPIFSTVIGGLWFFALQEVSGRPLIAAMVFLMAAAVGTTGIVSLLRLRTYMTEYLNSLARFEGAHSIPKAEGVSTVRAVIYLMRFAVAASLVGAAFAVLSLV